MVQYPYICHMMSDRKLSADVLIFKKQSILYSIECTDIYVGY